MIAVLLALTFALTAAAIFRTEIPILVDYPNHLARFWLLLGGARLAPMAAYYAVDWGHASLVGIDVLALLLGQVLPYTIAGKVIVFLALAGPPAGAACLSRVALGRWHWWQLSFPLLTFSTTALFGFLAFQISIALALAFACIDPSLPPRKGVKCILRIAFGLLILFFHPFGLGFYVLALFALIVGPDWRSLADRHRQTDVARDTLLSAPALVVPVLCLILFAPTPPGQHMNHSKFFWWGLDLRTEFYRALSPFMAYDMKIDILFVLPLLVIGGYAMYRNKISSHAGLVIAGLFLGVLSVISPSGVGDEPTFGMRFPTMAALLLFASILPEPFANRPFRIAIAAGVFALAFTRLAYIDNLWQSRAEGRPLP